MGVRAIYHSDSMQACLLVVPTVCSYRKKSLIPYKLNLSPSPSTLHIIYLIDLTYQAFMVKKKKMHF